MTVPRFIQQRSRYLHCEVVFGSCTYEIISKPALAIEPEQVLGKENQTVYIVEITVKCARS